MKMILRISGGMVEKRMDWVCGCMRAFGVRVIFLDWRKMAIERGSNKGFPNTGFIWCRVGIHEPDQIQQDTDQIQQDTALMIITTSVSGVPRLAQGKGRQRS